MSEKSSGRIFFKPLATNAHYLHFKSLLLRTLIAIGSVAKQATQITSSAI
ncbi:MAG TPA: hypothetical protein VIN60_03180 [Anaerolineales bacterium]